jgi:DNA modification methylase
VPSERSCKCLLHWYLFCCSPSFLEGFWVLNRGSVLNRLPDVSHGCWPLNPIFVNYFWQQRVTGIRDALGHLAGLLCIKFREDILIINIAFVILSHVRYIWLSIQNWRVVGCENCSKNSFPLWQLLNFRGKFHTFGMQSNWWRYNFKSAPYISCGYFAYKHFS